MNDNLCEAMKEAGITDPESNAGIQLCLNCPYPSGCIVLEEVPERWIERVGKLQRVQFLYESGKTRKEIAEMLKISKRAVIRYLRRLK